jgi:hypothetical protein
MAMMTYAGPPRLDDNTCDVSSTVTTATVSTVTAAVTIEGLGQIFTLTALILLGLALLFKEVIAGSTSRPMRVLARGMDLSLAPLLVAFLVMIGLNAGG